MKPPDEIRRDLVRQWLKKAEEDFGVAELLLAERVPYLSTVGFHLQQAAEKYLKALLVRHQVEFPKTHNLGKLLDLLAAVEVPLAETLEKTTRLDPYSVEARYPGDLPAVEREEAEEALTLTREVREKVSAILDVYLRPSQPKEAVQLLPEEPGADEPGSRQPLDGASEASAKAVEVAEELPGDSGEAPTEEPEAVE
jgi:HEPN domain-containing protein